ncbi:MAG: hypothetical protein J6W70_06635 [Lentisphaeria bacterium]|nr:hypothetical protein [Lentisphaeria bacterium]
MKIKFGILAAAVAALMFCSCSSNFEVPKIGTRFDDTKKYLVYDDDLNTYVIPLGKYEKLEYERFDLVVPTDDVVQYYAPALTNSSNHAELYVRNLPIETDFFGRAIYAPVMDGWKNLSDIEKFYKEKYTPDKYTISLATKISKFRGINCVEYDIMARLPETGKVIAVHGYCMFDPWNPGCIFDIGAGRTAYEKDIDDDFLIRASGLFLDSIKIHN